MPAAQAAKRTPSTAGRGISSFGAKGETLPISRLCGPRTYGDPLVVVFDATRGVRLVLRRSLASDRGILHRLLYLWIDDFDLSCVVQLLERVLRLLCGQLADNSVLDLIEGRQRTCSLFLNLDNVPAELRLHRIRDLTHL